MEEKYYFYKINLELRGESVYKINLKLRKNTFKINSVEKYL